MIGQSRVEPVLPQDPDQSGQVGDVVIRIAARDKIGQIQACPDRYRRRTGRFARADFSFLRHYSGAVESVWQKTLSPLPQH